MERRGIPNPAAGQKPRITLVIPTRNEEADIEGTLAALLKIPYQSLEILVIDDSTDRTPEIVHRYAPQGVRLLKGPGKGRCEARNLGIRQAQGEILILLNADVLLEPDFADRILPHYQKGADFLLVQARVANIEFPFPRYIQALHAQIYPDLNPLLWTEGFSCRRQAALQAGGFPEGFPIPLLGGEDWIFTKRLLSKGCVKAVDPTVVVRHIVPHDLRGFWKQQVDRGRADPLTKYFVLGRSIPRLLGEACVRSGFAAIRIGLIGPALLKALRLTRHSGRGLKDLLPFAGASSLEWIGYCAGVWRSLFSLMKGWVGRRFPARWESGKESV